MNNQTVEHARNGTIEDSGQIRNIADKVDSTLIDSRDTLTRIKLKINNLLWEELPSNISLETAERIACGMLQLVVDKCDL